MADALPPSTSAMEPLSFTTELPVLKEGGVEEKRPLVAYSSPPSSQDRSGLLDDGSAAPVKQDDVPMLCDEPQMASNEYAELEQRYNMLRAQHLELTNLASVYADIIRGSPAIGREATSLEQLRAEAGQEGLRAKALEAALLRPLIREAGEAKTLVTRIQTLQSLINEAGSLQDLEKEIGDIRMVRQRFDEVGGLQGLSRLVSEVHSLRAEQQEHVQLRAIVEGPNGLRTKAHKYDMLQQAFATIQRNPPVQAAQTGRTPAAKRPVHTMAPGTQASHRAGAKAVGAQGGGKAADAQGDGKAVVQGGGPALEGGPIINPGRAFLLSTVSDTRDPDRDLYEPPPPPPKPSKKTGSNDIPLGDKRRRQGASGEEAFGGGGDPKRLKYEDEPMPPAAPAGRRRKIDVSRASAIVQANLQGNAGIPWNDALVSRPAWVGGGGSWQVRFDSPMGSPFGFSTAGSAPSDGRLKRETSSDFMYPERMPGIKMEAHDATQR